MHLELAQLQHYVITPEKDVGNIDIELAPDRAPAEVPWRRPLDLRLRAALRLGVLLAFVLAAVILLTLRAVSLTHEAVLSTREEAKALAASTSLSLARQERRFALALLEGLSEKKQIAGVALYDLTGKRFADYAVSHSALLQLPALGSEPTYQSDFWGERFPGALVVWEPVKTRYENVGWLVMEVDLSARWQALMAELSWTGAALLAGFLLCASVVGRVQQRICDPMFRLAKTAKIIVEDRDYTLRAWKDGRDEIGSVTDGFNHLLDEIQRRGSSIVSLREQLARARAASSPAAPTAAGAEQPRQSQFMVNMCHEIRTPLNRMAGIARRLSESGLTSEQREMVASIRGTGEWVTALTDDLLDFSRLDAGKLELQMSAFDPTEMLHHVVRMHEERAASKQIKLRGQISSALPSMLRGDPARLRQVLGCLIGNSIKYSQGGEICVDIQVPASAGNQVTLSFEVRDSGFGVPEEARSRILEALSTRGEASNAPSGSAGLGLVISHHLVKRMGGKLELIEGAGPGHSTRTGLRFVLALESVQDTLTSAPAPGNPAPSADADATQSQPAALIYDDNGGNRKGLRQVLRKLGYRTESATNWEEVQQQLDQNQFQVVFASQQVCVQQGHEVRTLLALLQGVAGAQAGELVITYPRGQVAPSHAAQVAVLAYPFRRKEVAHVIAPAAAPAVFNRAQARAQSPLALTDQLLEVYLDSARDLVDQLKGALDHGDRPLIESTAHTLGSCSAKIGAGQLAGLCERIGTAVRSEAAFDGRPYVDQLEALYNATVNSLRAPAIEGNDGSPRKQASGQQPRIVA